MEELKLGIIGHGHRGAEMLNTILECFGDISVTYVCDEYDDRAECAANGLEDYVKRNLPDDENLIDVKFNQGDVVTTIIKCANGGLPISIPDFTCGKWIKNKDVIRDREFSLDF